MDSLYTILVKYPDSDWHLWNKFFSESAGLLLADVALYNEFAVNAEFKVVRVDFIDI